MIQRLFESDESPEDKTKADTKAEKSSGLSILDSTDDDRKIPDNSTESERFRGDSIHSDHSVATDLLATDDVIVETIQSAPSQGEVIEPVAQHLAETGELAALETEFSKIEDELIFEDLTETQREISVTDPVFLANKQPENPNVFTAAIEKGKREDLNASLQAEVLAVSDSELPAAEEKISENLGFVLPNRMSEPAETQAFILPNNVDEDNLPSFSMSSDYKPESKAEIIRKSGLAWSAGVAFFGSVLFLLILGWFADLLLGTQPWGAVGGVVLGSIIGFFQLIRLTSQILKDSP